MEESFKEYLQNFLRRYGINPEVIDYDFMYHLPYLIHHLEDQTSEDIDLLCAVRTILRLYRKEIYLFRSDYQSAEAYSKEKDKWVDDEKKGMFLTENYIERFLIDDTVKHAIYENKSKYAMGNPCPLSQRDCAFRRVAREIVERYEPYMTDDIREERTEQMLQRIYRRGGIINRLKRDLGFDIKKFDQRQYGSEKCKLIYFIYEMENHKLPELMGKKEFNLTQFLKESSMESVDNSVLGQEDYQWETCSGKILRIIRHTLEKEMDLQVKDKIWVTFDCVAHDWEQMMQSVKRQMELNSIYEKPSLDIETVKDLLLQRSSYLSQFAETEILQVSPIAVFYFIIAKYELLGEIRDYKKVVNISIEADYNVPSKLIPNMLRLHTKKIPLDCVKEYISNSADPLVDYVYFGEEKALNKDERKKQQRKIRESGKKVVGLLQSFARRKPHINYENEITILRIISCLQAILTDKNDVNFEYTAYGLGNHKPFKVSGALQETDEYALDSRIAFWERKVDNHLYANIGRYDIICKFREFQNMCFDVMNEIYSAKSISEMVSMHQIYYNNLIKLLDGFFNYHNK